MIGISVVVCCYNSATRIEQTLKHLACQSLNGIEAEVVLINNNSSDDTVEVAQSCWDAFNTKIPLRIIEEPKPGLTHARHTGIMHSQFDFVVFCDDDNWLDEKYLRVGFSVLDNDAEVGAVGGQGIPVYEISPIKCIEEHVEQYAIGPQAKQSGDVTYSKGYLYGAGITIRKSVYLELIQKGFTFVLSGRIGKSLVSGDDFEMCQAFVLAGYKLYYNESMIFHHYLTVNRLNKEYLIRMNKGFGYSIAFLYPYIYLSSEKNAKKGKSYYYILLKQIYRTVLTAFETAVGLKSFQGKLKWIGEYDALKSLLMNKSQIKNLCKTLPNQQWINKIDVVK